MSPPMHLTLHITNRCNLACRYCYARAGHEDMTFETAVAAIERCAGRENCGIIFFGGEPLLRTDVMWDVIRWGEKHCPNRFHYKVTTNGLLLDEAFLDTAARMRLHIALSHDGLGPAHDACRIRTDGSGTFRELEPVLRRLLARNPYSPILMTVNPATVDSFAASVRWLQEQGAQYLICSLNYAGGWSDATLAQLKNQYLELEAWHLENYRKERKTYFSPFDKRIATRIHDTWSTSCRLGRRQISVAPDGRLYPCVQFVGRDEYVIGDAVNGIDEVRRNAIFAMNEERRAQCEGCALVHRCHNKCGCLNMQTTGDIRTIPAVLCEHERMVFPIADRLAEQLFADRDPWFIHRHYNPAFPILSFLEDISAP